MPRTLFVLLFAISCVAAVEKVSRQGLKPFGSCMHKLNQHARPSHFICIYLYNSPQRGSSVSAGDCEELFLNQLDKATSSVDESAYRQCSNEHWPSE